METAYRQWERRQRPQRSPQRRPGVALGARERQRLLQLLICVVLFLAVFVGKGVFPQKIVLVREALSQIIGTDTDFAGAFSSLGRSISAGAPVLDTLGELWVDVFGSSATPVVSTGPTHPCPYGEARLLQPVTVTALLSSRFQGQAPPRPMLQNGVVPAPQFTAKPAPTPAPTPAPVPQVVHVDYYGPALPENATMDRYPLGLADTHTPVRGALSSPFGYREHPLEGGEKFHNGVDLAVDVGTAVEAFADGVVDYIGESPIYGQYMQVRHEGGVTSFYAHCSKLCAQKGAKIALGEKIAESGDSGITTGPHLHFELKRNGVLLNPSYYIRTE